MGKRQLEEMIVDWDPHALNQYLDLLSLEIELKRLAETLRKDKEQVAHLIAAIDAYTYWGPSRRRKEFQLHDSLGKALTLVDYKIRQKDIKFYRKFAARFPVVMGFENELMLAWTGILDHAVNSSYPGGAITIITYDDIAFNMVIVEIIDHGTGVPKDVQRKFPGGGPFHKTNSPGLDLAYRIIVYHHSGMFGITSQPGFTKLKISLPIEWT